MVLRFVTDRSSLVET
ncbi:hypothetical protein, partial [Vibrio parahaemolyticus]